MPGFLLIEDGPATGCPMLMLHRFPLYLRVVKAMDGKFDALDQLDDDPELGETIYIYKRVNSRAGHIKGATRATSGFMFLYRHIDDIDPAGMEDRDAWRAAVEAAAEREREAATNG